MNSYESYNSVMEASFVDARITAKPKSRINIAL